MDRGGWQTTVHGVARVGHDLGGWEATVHGVARVGHDLATKPPPPDHPKEIS